MTRGETPKFLSQILTLQIIADFNAAGDDEIERGWFKLRRRACFCGAATPGNGFALVNNRLQL